MLNCDFVNPFRRFALIATYCPDDLMYRNFGLGACSAFEMLSEFTSTTAE
jgi:hypothetical protein